MINKSDTPNQTPGLKILMNAISCDNARLTGATPHPDWEKMAPQFSIVDQTEIDRQNKWHDRWFKRAADVAQWSKDPSSKIGAVIVNEEEHLELSAGYNGFPKGIKDDDRLTDRETKYRYVVHAEKNAIYNAVNKGVKLQGSSIYIWGLPICSECAKVIIQVAVKNVYVKKEFVEVERWKESWVLAQQMFSEAGVKVYIK